MKFLIFIICTILLCGITACNKSDANTAESKAIENTIQVKSVKYSTGNVTNYHLKLDYNNFLVTETDNNRGYSFRQGLASFDASNNEEGLPKQYIVIISDVVHFDLDADGFFDARVTRNPHETHIWHSDSWVKVGNSKTRFDKVPFRSNKNSKFQFTNGKWIKVPKSSQVSGEQPTPAL